MVVPTRAQLESLKRPALQQKCKELGIKANSKSELLIDLILAYYQSQPGSSKPSTSTKRKATETHPAACEDATDRDNVVSGRQRMVSTRRRGALATPVPAGPPPAKIRRVGTRTRVKVEPAESGIMPSPRRGQIMEVVLDSPRRSLAKGKGKGKEKEVPPRVVRATIDQEEGSTEPEDNETQASQRTIPGARPLEGHKTNATDIDIEVADTPSIPRQTAINETRVSDLEMQLRNVRKSGDDIRRDIKVLLSFQATVEDALNEIDSDSISFADSMTLLAKLRDIAPKLVAVSSVDVHAMSARVELVLQAATDLETIQKQNRTTIAELKERVRELEEGKTAVGGLEAMVRQLQSQVSAIHAQTQNVPTEDSGTECIYTIIRGPSYDSTALVTGAQSRPSSRLSAPPEENGRLLSQDQNQGRASSISRGLRSTRPPLAEKEGARVGQPDVEVETSDPRRSIRRLVESSLSSTGNSAPPSRGRSVTPSQRESSSANPTPSQSKGKGRFMKNGASVLDTVEEVGDASTLEQTLENGALTATSSNPPTQPLLGDKTSPAPTATTNTSVAAENGIERLPSPPALHFFSPDVEPSRSPVRSPEVGQNGTSGSPPSSASKSSSKGFANQESSPTHNFVPQKSKVNGPIAQLPFKLIASPAKPQPGSNQLTARPSVPMGRVPKAPRSHQPLQSLGRRAGGSRKNASDVPINPASVFSFALPEASSSQKRATTIGTSLGATTSQLDNPAGFITPERLGNNFNMFPQRFDLGKTPGGLAFKATGRAPPGTPAATTTLFGTEVARDTRFADLPYDPDASRVSLSWEEPALPPWPGVTRTATE
ncbi:hypothetical protein FRC07_007831 [Ceratobasidium sp. 392]|nr:hypothetical protein FRC07_007831 [Ceratobasidium sp. 392]